MSDKVNLGIVVNVLPQPSDNGSCPVRMDWSRRKSLGLYQLHTVAIPCTKSSTLGFVLKDKISIQFISVCRQNFYLIPLMKPLRDFFNWTYKKHSKPKSCFKFWCCVLEDQWLLHFLLPKLYSTCHTYRFFHQYICLFISSANTNKLHSTC